VNKSSLCSMWMRRHGCSRYFSTRESDPTALRDVLDSFGMLSIVPSAPLCENLFSVLPWRRAAPPHQQDEEERSSSKLPEPVSVQRDLVSVKRDLASC
jgi:hypothetical protein